MVRRNYSVRRTGIPRGLAMLGVGSLEILNESEKIKQIVNVLLLALNVRNLRHER